MQDPLIQAAIARVLAGDPPRTDDEVILDSAVARWLQRRGEAHAKGLAARALQLADQKQPLPSGQATKHLRRLPIDGEAVQNLLTKHGLPTLSGMEPHWTPSPEKLHYLVEHGVLPSEEVAPLLRYAFQLRIQPHRAVKTALLKLASPEGAATPTDTDEDDQ
jgi:hypothetical protein